MTPIKVNEREGMGLAGQYNPLDFILYSVLITAGMHLQTKRRKQTSDNINVVCISVA